MKVATKCTVIVKGNTLLTVIIKKIRIKEEIAEMMIGKKLFRREIDKEL